MNAPSTPTVRPPGGPDGSPGRDTADPLAFDASGDWDAVTVVLPVVRVGSVPQMNVTVEDAPFEVPVPLMVAVVPVTDVAGSVVTAGGATMVNCSMLPCTVLLFP